MNCTSTLTDYRGTGFYSKIILDYLEGKEQLKPFYAHPVSVAGIKAAIENRDKYPTNRKLLVEILNKHYKDNAPTTRQQLNIGLLSKNNTYSITTAHQPNIFTGHLYFIYKILHTIKLCEQLKNEMPENNYVPVFYMGSEDADLDELGHIFINGNKHFWETKQTGAVGRMKVDKGLQKMLSDIAGEITVEPFGKDIIDTMSACYTEGATIEQATFKLINILFGSYGLLVLLPDDAEYKRAFNSVTEKELKEQFSYKIVEHTVSNFPKEYKVQAAGRALNMFYLKDDLRERIEKLNDQYTVVNTEYSFSEKEMMEELHEHPERFSPNVILRPVFQEMILPNIAFIGGGGELAYWLELKKVFDAVLVPYPVLILRNSFLLAEKKQIEKISQLGFSVIDLFKPKEDLLNALVKRETTVQLSLQNEKKTLQEFYDTIKKVSGEVDVTLIQHTDALRKQAVRKIEVLEKKMLKAEKKKFEAQQRQIQKIKLQLFPHNNLQERIENFMSFYAKYGRQFIDTVYEFSLGVEQEFCIIELK
ncbi:MAG TPA: bacillithiol biosynthesis cysteine-adding enzyme BshC [Ferruginibacter sp.]|nr:bacillithiol biosynthesis cysteine-adding enzyme BshC [Ferruginibacter sp.]